MNTDYKTIISVDLGFEVNPNRPITSFSRFLTEAKCGEVHAHPRAQLLFASGGIMKVAVENQLWIVTPVQGIWIPGGRQHQVFFPENVQVATLFIDPSFSPSLSTDTFAFELSVFLKCLVKKNGGFWKPIF
ncbi:hypothetical protein DN752_19105 [Echinicola strongylocentroti]|uniref:AraC-type arabinose-binding/dimerisation domain-containing protein n=1 Tax=Echinicola strongylocentroti TaxID=1795355 RepID=A0A2Z4IP12_9BACT|nr:hypothetical protein [Echinicola strongylocentroti]AWW32073.1 hypothetical protein DN752_19105 [Echinicola strongylocentroti]